MSQRPGEKKAQRGWKGQPVGRLNGWGIDVSSKEYIETVAGLWCASLGFGSERLARVAYEQMRKLGYLLPSHQAGPAGFECRMPEIGRPGLRHPRETRNEADGCGIMMES